MNKIFLPRASHARVAEAASEIKKGSLLWEYKDATGDGVLYIKNGTTADTLLAIAGERAMKSFYYRGVITTTISSFPEDTSAIGDAWVCALAGTGDLAALKAGALIIKLANGVWHVSQAADKEASKIVFSSELFSASNVADALNEVAGDLDAAVLAAQNPDTHDEVTKTWASADINDIGYDGVRLCQLPCAGITYIGSDTIIFINGHRNNNLFRAATTVGSGTSFGESVSSGRALGVAYVGNGRLVWKVDNSASFVLLSGANGNTDYYGYDLITNYSINKASYPVFMGNDTILFTADNYGSRIYKHNLTPSAFIGTLVVNVANCSHICRIDEKRIVYSNGSDSGRLYLKDITDGNTNAGTRITTVRGMFPCYVGKNKLVYSNYADANRLYIKSLDDDLTGDRQNTGGASYTTYVGRGYIIYANAADNNFMYKRQVIAE